MAAIRGSNRPGPTAVLSSVDSISANTIASKPDYYEVMVKATVRAATPVKALTVVEDLLLHGTVWEASERGTTAAGF